MRPHNKNTRGMVRACMPLTAPRVVSGRRSISSPGRRVVLARFVCCLLLFRVFLKIRSLGLFLLGNESNRVGTPPPSWTIPQLRSSLGGFTLRGQSQPRSHSATLDL